jgi:hypothetical protein
VNEEEIIARVREQVAGSPDTPPPAPAESVAELEALVGHPMPRLLKRIYLEVADGGFGRWGQALSFTHEEYQFSDSELLIETYRRWAAMPNYPTPVVPLLTWGCAIWSFVDFRTPEGRMWGWDPNVRRCPQHKLFPEDITLAERLVNWLDGRDDGEFFPKPSSSIVCSDCGKAFARRPAL